MVSRERLVRCQSLIREAVERLETSDNLYFNGCLSIRKRSDRCKVAFDSYFNSLEDEEVSLRFLVLAFSLDRESVECSYKLGVFKPTKYLYDYPQRLFEHIFSIGEVGVVSEEVKRYISSLVGLILFCPVVRRVRESILEIIARDGEVFLKTVLAYADYFFLIQSGWRCSNGQVVTKEELAEACSYIASLYFDTVSDLPEFNCDIREECLHEYMGVILCAHIVKQYVYAEMMIGKLPYSAEMKDKALIISPLDSYYEKCRVAGYFNHAVQGLKVGRGVLEGLNGADDFVEFFNSKKSELSKTLVTRVSDGDFERLVFCVDTSDGGAASVFEALLMYDGDFPDEILNLAYICSQFHVDLDVLSRFRLAGELQVVDAVKAKRLLGLVGGVFGEALREFCGQGEFPPSSLVMRSILPVFKRDGLCAMLASVVGEQAAESFLKIFTYKPGFDSFFDIQYKPIVDMGGFCYCNMQVLMHSELIRNALMYHKQRFFEDNTFEPLVERLYVSLYARIASTRRNYRVGSQEVDCIAITDGFIFIFEVKNTFLPCNYAEERVTYDHVVKSARQLTNAVNEIQKQHVQEKIEKDFGIAGVLSRRVLTCTILGTRVFTGYCLENHAVRYIDEATNFLDTGVGLRNGEKLKMWQGDTFTENDLVQFVEAGGTNCILSEYCESAPEVFQVADYSLVFETFKIRRDSLLPPECVKDFGQ